ncbi:MAG: hypothetical protein CSA34_04835 [Desulfobulbus propionicus]|nr:MAG: hypothetical protein CSA34_04835 [Desulfobulbus propionicus]
MWRDNALGILAVSLLIALAISVFDHHFSLAVETLTPRNNRQKTNMEIQQDALRMTINNGIAQTEKD